jgi:hypothetical protein
VHDGASGEALVPASALLSEGVAAFRLPAGDRKAFAAEAARGGEVAPATVAREALPFASAPLSEVRLVHVPFWDVGYRMFGTPGRVLLDAVSGQALPLSPVPTSESRLDKVYAVLLAALFLVAFAGFHRLFRGEEKRGLLLLLGAGPALLLVARQVIVRLEES